MAGDASPGRSDVVWMMEPDAAEGDRVRLGGKFQIRTERAPIAAVTLVARGLAIRPAGESHPMAALAVTFRVLGRFAVRDAGLVGDMAAERPELWLVEGA